MNLWASGQLDTPLGFAAALLIGLGFGFWLERAGFGSSRKLTAIFYFEDFAVLKVMFAAMVTAALGLQGLALLGAVDLASIAPPATAVWPQVVGGLLFGAGFVAGGWCPGTASVGLASGRLDALVFLLGAGLGSLLFAGIEPAVQSFTALGLCESCSVADLLGIAPWQAASGLAVIAGLAFVGATFIERHNLRSAS